MPIFSLKWVLFGGKKGMIDQINTIDDCRGWSSVLCKCSVLLECCIIKIMVWITLKQENKRPPSSLIGKKKPEPTYICHGLDCIKNCSRYCTGVNWEDQVIFIRTGRPENYLTNKNHPSLKNIAWPANKWEKWWRDANVGGWFPRTSPHNYCGLANISLVIDLEYTCKSLDRRVGPMDRWTEGCAMSTTSLSFCAMVWRGVVTFIDPCNYYLK